MSHAVCPEEVAYKVARSLVEEGEPYAGYAVLLVFDTYLRAEEVLGLKTTDVFVLPETSEQRGHHAVVQVLKGKRDERITVTVRPRFLAKVLERWKLEREMSDGEGCNLIGMRGRIFRDLIHKTCGKLQLTGLRITPHTLRYGGASTDKLQGRATSSEIQARGQCKTSKTMDQYVQVGALLRQKEKAPKEVTEEGAKYVEDPWKAFGVARPQLRGSGLEGSARER